MAPINQHVAIQKLWQWQMCFLEKASQFAQPQGIYCMQKVVQEKTLQVWLIYSSSLQRVHDLIQHAREVHHYKCDQRHQQMKDIYHQNKKKEQSYNLLYLQQKLEIVLQKMQCEIFRQDDNQNEVSFPQQTCSNCDIFDIRNIDHSWLYQVPESSSQNALQQTRKFIKTDYSIKL